MIGLKLKIYPPDGISRVIAQGLTVTSDGLEVVITKPLITLYHAGMIRIDTNPEGFLEVSEPISEPVAETQESPVSEEEHIEPQAHQEQIMEVNSRVTHEMTTSQDEPKVPEVPEVPEVSPTSTSSHEFAPPETESSVDTSSLVSVEQTEEAPPHLSPVSSPSPISSGIEGIDSLTEEDIVNASDEELKLWIKDKTGSHHEVAGTRKQLERKARKLSADALEIQKYRESLETKGTF